jgi:hypothetical protein
MKRILLLATIPLLAQTKFKEHTVATEQRGGYQVIVADMNHDGKPDLISLASGLTELAWYENPGWQKHTIVTGIRQPINAAVVRLDARGIPVIALAHEFSPQAKRSIGTVSILENDGNEWKRMDIDKLPTSHRLRMMNGLLVNAPLTNEAAEAPDYRGHVPLVFYKPGEWKRTLVTDADEGVLHCIYPFDWDGDGKDELLTASFQGVFSIKQEKNGSFTRTKIAEGSPEAWPKSGASDVAVGHLQGKTGKKRFITTIEPWHGNIVAVYVDGKREVIDSSLVDAHTLLTGDLDGNGNDVIIAGYRGKGSSVNLYRYDGKQWQKSLLDDGGMAGAGCAVADLNGDGKLDVACIGTSTANLKWYENLGKQP